MAEILPDSMSVGNCILAQSPAIERLGMHRLKIYGEVALGISAKFDYAVGPMEENLFDLEPGVLRNG